MSMTYFSKASFPNGPQDLEVVEVHCKRGQTDKHQVTLLHWRLALISKLLKGYISEWAYLQFLTKRLGGTNSFFLLVTHKIICPLIPPCQFIFWQQHVY